MSQLLFDLRDGLRAVRRDRLYAAAVVGTLALTLGATTAIFSIVNGVLLQPLDYREANRLVAIREIVPQAADRYPTLPVNARHFEEWRTRTTTFESMAELDWRTANMTGVGEPAQVKLLRASGALFDVLQTPIATGRALNRDDERTERPAVAVIAHRLWIDRFGGGRAAIGRILTLGGRPFTVVGVLPPGYEMPTFDVLANTGSLTSDVDVIVPLRIDLNNVEWMGQFNFPVVARVKPGIAIDRARAEMNVMQAAVAEIASRETHDTTELRAWVAPLGESIVGRARLGLLLLLGAIGGVVLIACSNLANLSLARTLGRLRDAAVRTALGASRGRLVRRVVIEQLVLAGTGGALGLLVARQALNVFVRTAPIDLPRVNDVAIDARVLAFAAAVSVVSGLLVSLLPAWRLGRADVQAALRSGGYGATDRGGVRARATLVGVQVALSVMLLVVTGLFVASFVRLLRTDPGFSTEHVIAVEMSPTGTRYPDIKGRAALYDRILERVHRVPAIASAAFTSALPLTGETWVDVIARPDDVRQRQHPPANYRFIGPDYFRTLSMPLTRGRSIEERDRTAATTPAVISARAARALWPDQDPIGRRFIRGNPDEPFEVVGVVVDGHTTALETQSPLMVYVPYWFNNEGKSILVVRSSADPAAILADVRRAIRDVDPEIAIPAAKPLQDVVDAALGGRRYQMWLFVAFGAIAILIATIGVYATTAYAVSRRRREMNIRVALGAQATQVVRLTVWDSAMPVLLGIGAGAAAAIAAGSVVASLLFEVRARDPLVIGSVIGLVGLVGVLACVVAARQGLVINPAAALREE